MVVSNDLPLQTFEEYPKNCTNNLVIQKIPRPKEIRLPKLVFRSKSDEVRQRTPIRKTASAIKKECTYIN